jgi:hypothetical protein
MEQAKRGDVIPPRARNSKIPRALERICMKAMAASPVGRYPSVDAFSQALRRYRTRATRWTAAAVAAGGLVLGAALFWSYGLRSRESAKAADPAVAQRAAPIPLSAEMEVLVHRPGIEEALSIDQSGVLPIRQGDVIQIKAALSEPAYVYLIWLDADGHVDPLYPWDRNFLSNSPPEVRRKTVISPEEVNRGWPVEGPSGLETALLLVRRTPIESASDFLSAVGTIPPSPMRDPREYAVLRFEGGQLVVPATQAAHRGLGKVSRLIDEPLLQLMERLRAHFDVAIAYRFAHEAK